MTLTLPLPEEDRQLVLMALAGLSLRCPGFDHALNLIALRMDHNEGGRAALYSEFRKLAEVPDLPPSMALVRRSPAELAQRVTALEEALVHQAKVKALVADMLVHLAQFDYPLDYGALGTSLLALCQFDARARELGIIEGNAPQADGGAP